MKSHRAKSRSRSLQELQTTQGPIPQKNTVGFRKDFASIFQFSWENYELTCLDMF